MQVKHCRPTDKKCRLRAGLEPVARSKWMSHRLIPKLLNRIVSWTEASRCWGIYRERTKRLQFMREEAVKILEWKIRFDVDESTCSDFWLLSSLTYICLTLHYGCAGGLYPPTPYPPKNEQRNEWLKSSTVENRLKKEREREREMSTSTTTSKIQQRYMFYTLASLTYWRNTAREALNWRKSSFKR